MQFKHIFHTSYRPVLAEESASQTHRRISHVKLLIVLSILLSTFGVSCKKFIEIDPPKTQLISNTVFTSDETAIAAMVGIYSEMMGTSASFANTQVSILGGLSADELVSYSGTWHPFYNNALSANSSQIIILWRDTYQYIYQANAVLEGLSNSTGVTAAVKKQLEGEAKFFRAFSHFYLVNLFGDVPYVMTTDYRINAVASRTPKSEVYQKIIADLKDAQNLLSDDYITGEKVRPNKSAATALLARIYLYTQDWATAGVQATAVINNTTYSLESDLSNVFLANSTEAIWQLMPVSDGYNTWEGNRFILTSAPTSVALSNQLLNAFETGDNRKASWVGSITIGAQTYYYPYKYKIQSGFDVTEYSMVLRLAEQYLTRAEARAQQNNISGAVEDLNVIRARAGLADLSTLLTQAQCLAAIEQERRVELFTELGHRWLDLKRTGRADAVLAPIKAQNWQSTDVLYPILQSEIKNNPNLTQNPGY